MPRTPRPSKPRPDGPVKVGKKSKTGDPRCSEAMSQWVRLRNMGAAIAPAIFALLGKCRSMARGRRQAESHARAGNDLKAQHLRARYSSLDGPLSVKDRKAAVKAKLAERAARNHARASVPAPTVAKPGPRTPTAPSARPAAPLAGRVGRDAPPRPPKTASKPPTAPAPEPAPPRRKLSEAERIRRVTARHAVGAPASKGPTPADATRADERAREQAAAKAQEARASAKVKAPARPAPAPPKPAPPRFVRRVALRKPGRESRVDRIRREGRENAAARIKARDAALSAGHPDAASHARATAKAQRLQAKQAKASVNAARKAVHGPQAAFRRALKVRAKAQAARTKADAAADRRAAAADARDAKRKLVAQKAQDAAAKAERKANKAKSDAITREQRTKSASWNGSTTPRREIAPDTRPQPTGTSEARTTSPAPWPGEVERRMGAAYLRLSEGRNNVRVYLHDLRQALPNVSRHEFDRALTKLQIEGHAAAYRLNDPREIQDTDRAAVFHTPSGEPRHIVYMDDSASRYRPKPVPSRRAVTPAAARLLKNGRKAAPPAPSFKLDAPPPKAAPKGFESSGGRTPYLFDMKRGDLPGQTTIFDRVATVHTHEGTPAAKTSARLSGAPPAPSAASLARASDRDPRIGRLERWAMRRATSVRRSDLEAKAPHRFGRVGKTYESFDVAHLHADPERFQYKRDAVLKGGVTDELHDVAKWDPDKAGTIYAWRDPSDGKVYVVNGHHRFDLAKRLGVGKVQVKLIDARDAEHAKVQGAMMNIGDDKGTALDAATVFRRLGADREAIRAEGISLKGAKASAGLKMAALSDRGFRALERGDLTDNRAAIIGGSGLTHAQQDALLDELKRGKNRKATDATVREMAEQAKAAATTTVKERSLFGETEEEKSLFGHRARATASIAAALKGDERLFKLVSKSKAAEALADRGNSTIDRDATGAVADESNAVMRLFHGHKNLKGPISDALNEAAERIESGTNEKEAIAHARRKITAHVKRILSGEESGF